MSGKPVIGIIILGNSGSGKSFLCNILIGKERFEAGFCSTAVTKVTEHHRIELDQSTLLIFNIPGLIEANQEEIEENKRQIERAFLKCPNSIVLFVWAQVGGRVQNDDVIAYKALYKAYKFPEGSLAFVVNNLPPSRPPDYDSKVIVTLSTLVGHDMDEREFIFVDHMDPHKSEEEKRRLNEKARLQLYALVSKHRAAFQKKKKDIDVEADQLKKIREELKKQLAEAQEDREAYQAQIESMREKLRVAEEETNRRIEGMQKAFTENKKSPWEVLVGGIFPILPPLVHLISEIGKRKTEMPFPPRGCF